MSLEQRMENIKYYRLHGNGTTDVGAIGGIEGVLESWGEDEDGEKKLRSDGDSPARMLKYVREIDTNITNNARFIVNYGERYRNGEAIATGFVESAVNQIISGYKTLPEIELRALGAKLEARINFLQSLSRARTNLEGAEDYLKDLIV